MHHSKWLALLLAVSLFMGSTVGTSAMAAETVEEAASAVSEEDTSPAISENESAVKETAIVEESVIAVPEDKEEETEEEQEAASDDAESADNNDDTKDVQDETKDEEIPEEADIDSQDEVGKELLTEETTAESGKELLTEETTAESGKELLTEETTAESGKELLTEETIAESEADTQEIINEAKSSFSDDQSIGEGYTNATEISVNDELNTNLNYNYAYYKFTPEKDGIYNFSVYVHGPMSATIWIYDDGLNLLAKSGDNSDEIADRLEASRTYYFEVYSAGDCEIQLKETTFFVDTAQSYFKPKFGEEITLSVNAYSDNPIEYMWYDEYDNLIAGVETADYTFVPEKLGSHEYRCEVTDGVNSAKVFFTVEVINTVHAEAVCTSFNVNQGETVTLEVNAYSDNGVLPSYKWYNDSNSLVSGDNGKSKSVLTVHADKTKQYTCYAYINNAISSPSPQPGEIVRIKFYINVSEHPTHVHDLEKTEEHEATCTEDGNIEFWTCSECNKLFSDASGTEETTLEATVIPAKGHKWNTTYTTDKKPTTTSEGSKSIHCSVCASIKPGSVQVIPKLIPTWKKDSTGWRYDYGDSTYPVNKFENIDGKKYYFNEAGYRITGWKKIGNYWYFFNNDGTMHIAWRKVGDIWYYFNGEGHLLTGKQKINGYWYYFNGNGARQTGWQKIGDYWYYFNSDGKMHVGWRKVGDIWYYFNGDGHLLTGLQKVNGYWYYFNGNGARQTGWQTIGSNKYYFDSDGKMHIGWKLIDNSWYYFNADGIMVTGRQQINGKWYNFSSSGVRL